MTIYRYLNAEGFPERAQDKTRFSILEPYLSHIHRQFVAGSDNASDLWREVVAIGYTGKIGMVRRYVRRLRHRVAALSEDEKQRQRRLASSFATPSAKRAAHWLIKDESSLKEDEQLFVHEMMRTSPPIKRISELSRQFQRMVKEKDARPFATWLSAVQASGIKELAGFAIGLKNDIFAVGEALRSKWSNGQTEGQINRLKFLKRQMYGRANLDLLRARVLYAA